MASKGGKQNINLSHPVKNKRGNLVSSTKEKMEVFHDHYKKLASDPTGVSSSLEYWSEAEPNEYLIESKDKEWDINQGISIREAISSSPNYKASGPDGIPIEFYKALIPEINEENTASPGLNSLSLVQSYLEQ